MGILIAILTVLIGSIAAWALVNAVKAWITMRTMAVGFTLFPKLRWRWGNLKVALQSAFGSEYGEYEVRKVSKDELFRMYINDEISYSDYLKLTEGTDIEI